MDDAFAIVNQLAKSSSAPAKQLQDNGSAINPSAAASARTKLVKDERLNFQFRPSDASWIPIDAKRVNPRAVAVYTRRFPELFLMIIAERIGVEANLTLDGMVEACRANMQAMAADSREVELRRHSVRGMDCMRLVQERTVKGVKTRSVQWLLVNNGFGYQLIVSGRSSDFDVVADEADRALANFDLVDRKLICHTDGIAPLREFSVAADGFRLDLSRRGWSSWNGMASTFPSAEFGALRGDEGLAVIPIHFDDFKPAREARLAAFLATFGCTDAESAIAKREAIKVDSQPATRCTFQRPGIRVGEVYYSLSVVQTDDFDYCISVLSTKSQQRAASTLDEVLSQVKLLPPMEKLPKSIAETDAHRLRGARFFNLAGMYFLKSRRALESEPCFLKALEFAPDMTVVLDNYVTACLENGRHQPALDAMDKYASSWKENSTSKLMHAWLLSKTNRTEKAIAEFESTFKGSVRNENYFCGYARLLMDAGRGNEALAAMNKYLEGGDSLTVALIKSQCLRELGKLDDALTLVQDLHKRSPGNLDVRFVLLDTLEEAGRYTEAHDLAKEMLADGRESVNVLIRKGMLEMHLKWYKEAKATFEEALQRSPGDERIQTCLNRVSGILGEGTNVQLKQPLAQVELPPELRGGEPPALNPDLLADAQAYYRRRVTAIEFEPEKVYRTSVYESIQILTDTGAKRFSTLDFDFDPLAEKIFVNRLEVLDEHGKTLTTGDTADYFVVDENQGEIASHRKTLHVPIAGIRPGSRIEICVTKEEIVAPRELRYVKHFFASGSPTALEIVSVAADPKRVAWIASPEVKQKTSSRGLYWQVDQRPGMHYEPDADEFDAQAPVLRIVDKQASWKVQVADYHKEIEKLLPVTDSVRALAADLTRNAADRPGKLAAVLDYLQKQLTYKAIEFGRRARVMNSAD
ncbi:MAG TPA: tetratricopeptide repeat protein, partial [Pirellulales bacterium]|nr:tetratricopeptide repeat protein [Pirellulales bacterium]